MTDSQLNIVFEQSIFPVIQLYLDNSLSPNRAFASHFLSQPGNIDELLNIFNETSHKKITNLLKSFKSGNPNKNTTWITFGNDENLLIYKVFLQTISSDIHITTLLFFIPSTPIQNISDFVITSQPFSKSQLGVALIHQSMIIKCNPDKVIIDGTNQEVNLKETLSGQMDRILESTENNFILNFDHSGASFSFGIKKEKLHFNGLEFLKLEIEPGYAKTGEAKSDTWVTGELLKLISESTDSVLWEWDIVTSNVKVSEKWLTILGYKPDFIPYTSQGWLSLCHPLDFPRVKMKWVDHFAGKSSIFEDTYRMHSADGHWKYIFTRGKVVEWTENRAIKAVGIHYDVTSLKLLEETLLKKESEISFQNTLLDQISENVIVSDINSNIVYINQSAMNLLDISKHPAGLNLSSVLPDTFSFAANKEIFKLTLENGEWESSHTFVKNDNREHNYIMKCRLIKSSYYSKPDLICTVISDISNQISATKAREDLERKLLQAQKISSIGMLVGEIAHDFKNILTTISGNTELALLEPEGSNIRQYLKDIQTATDSSSGLISRLLSFSRRHESVFRPIDLNEIIIEMQETLQRIIGERIRLIFTLHNEAVLIKADKNRLEQVILNLLINAKDSISGSGVITIKTSRVYIENGSRRLPPNMKNGRFSLLSISDTGCGITKSDLEHIFEAFFTTKNENQGTGLGLSTVKGIIQNHNGFIDVESEPGHGTTFNVYIPFSTHISTGNTNKKSPAGPLSGGNEKILLVEDDVQVRGITTKILKRLGYETTVCENSEDAWDLISSGNEFNLIISDIVMPGMGGIEFSELILKKNENTRILLISGYADNDALNEKLKYPSVSFLPKPYTPQALSEKIRSILKTKIQ
ncbi:response regulator [Myxococcota bacterium]|nr:response regulator [Myxococcota bacterium]MBU1382510.1 response regulator [Myxococcota bacterium]MBU1497584.1 response regulator [Myxococcota bacterium]